MRATVASSHHANRTAAAMAPWSMTFSASCDALGCTDCTEPSPFNSIPASFYWAAVTMTTVGYGDVYPTTTAGQFVASLTMMVGILILALPITVIGTYFAAEYEEYLRRQKIDADYHERLAKKRELAAASARDGVSDRGLGVAMSQANSNQDPEDPSAKATREHAT